MTYLIVSEYLKDKRIKNYFKDKKWLELKKGKNLTLLYLDSMNIYKSKYYTYKPFIRNLMGDEKHNLSNKSNLSYCVSQKYLMNYHNFNIEDDIEKYNIIFKNKTYILKPSKGREGIGIKIVRNFDEFKNFFEKEFKTINFKKIKDLDKWVIQEYIETPMLFMKRKFHLRVYFLIFDKEIFYFTKFIIATAAKEYRNSDYEDIDIHDSHYNEKSIRDKIFPEDFNIYGDIEKDEKLIIKINKQVNDMFIDVKKNINLPIKCYPGDKNCYENFAVDIMVTEDEKIKVLEFNNSIGVQGQQSLENKGYPLFENQLDIVLSHYNLINANNIKGDNYFQKI